MHSHLPSYSVPPPLSPTPSLPTPTAPPTKKLRVSDPVLSSKLGKFIARDVDLNFVRQRRPRSDLNKLDFQHPARRLLKLYRDKGVPVRLTSKPWSQCRLHQAIQRGPHPSCLPFQNFLNEEFIDMINKGQWVVLPYSVARYLPDLRLSPPGVVPQRERRPRWICDHTFYGINGDTLPLVPLEAMQFGHALDR